MERALWQPERLTDFGPNPFWPHDPPPITELQGSRPRELRAGVLRQCLNEPGVYGLLDEQGVLIYVGKSKQLRTRLLSYFSPRVKNQKPGRLIRQAQTILWEPAPSDFAAMLRELQLIQHWQPRGNVKDIPHRTRSFFIGLGRPHAPGVTLSTKPAPHAVATFGPIWGGRHLQRAVEALNRLFLLRDCPNSQAMAFSDQPPLFVLDQRPGCLRFEMRTCLGPCVAACSLAEYSKQVKAARKFLAGECDQPLIVLKQRMDQAASQRQFELAARLRDDLVALGQLRERLDRIRAAQEQFHFVYPVAAESGGEETLWYLIRGGRVAHVTPPPVDAVSSKAVRQLLEATYGRPSATADLTRKRPDTLLLVTSWFPNNPAELDQTLSPPEALKRCRLRRPR